MYNLGPDEWRNHSSDHSTDVELMTQDDVRNKRSLAA